MMLCAAGISRAVVTDAAPPAPKASLPEAGSGAAALGAIAPAAWPGPDVAELEPADPEQPATSSSPAPVRSAAHEGMVMRRGIPRRARGPAPRSGRAAPGEPAGRLSDVVMPAGTRPR